MIQVNPRLLAVYSFPWISHRLLAYIRPQFPYTFQSTLVSHPREHRMCEFASRFHKNLVKHLSPASKKVLSVSQGQNNFLTAHTSSEFIQSASETVIILCLLHYT